MALYTKRQNWEEVVKLSEEHQGKFDKTVFIPYAEWLAFQDRFDDALQAYWKAGRPDMSEKLMLQLAGNAITEGRFKDTSYYYYLMAADSLKAITVLENENKENYLSEKDDLIKKHENLMNMAGLYFAYDYVQSFTNAPFTNLQPLVLFQASRFLINSLKNSEAPPGISRVNTLHTLAKQAKNLGAYKLARFVYDRLQKLKVPDEWIDSIDIDILTIQSKPVRDNPELLPVCYRCGYTNPLLNPFTSQFVTGGDVCTNCGHPFFRCWINFDILPLVEFKPESTITDVEALDMIRSPPLSMDAGRKRGGRGSRQYKEDDNMQSMTFGDDNEYDDNVGGDFFNKCLNRTLEHQEGATAYLPIIVDSKTLLNLKREEVFVCKSESGTVYYKNVLYPDVSIACSQSCRKFFHEEEFEFQYLTNSSCPFSRQKDVGDYGSV